MPQPHPIIRLSAEDEKASWSRELSEASAGALAEAERRLGLTLDEPPLVQAFTTEAEFYRELGSRPHNVIAAAVPHENRIVINLPRFIGGGASGSRTTLVHEFTHLILGRRLPQSPPRWVDEGLAMVTSGESSFAYHTRIVTAATFGRLIPLEELQGAAFDAHDQELAYAEALAVTRFVLHGNDPKEFVAKLADPTEGRALRDLLSDPGYISRLDHEWRKSIRTLWTWIAALSGGGVIWLGVTFLFLIAYWRKRRMSRARAEQWAQDAKDFPWME